MIRRINTWVAIIAASAAFASGLNGCATLSALADLKHLQFKLGDVNNFRLSGVDISHAASKGDISFGDIASVTASILQKQLPVSFTLNVAVRNPNDGTGGHPATNLYLRKLEWELSIDNRTTINGVVDQRLEIPASGRTTTIPITMQLDLYKFFGDHGADDLINLALAMGGRSGSASRLKLTSHVTVEVPPLSPIRYPGEITIVDKSFTNP